jgi:hypothetical protein
VLRGHGTLTAQEPAASAAADRSFDRVRGRRDLAIARAARVATHVRYPGSMSVVLKWNGRELPNELRQLPEGRYVIEPVDDAPVLTEAEEEGIELALASVRDGRGVSMAEAKERIDRILGR